MISLLRRIKNLWEISAYKISEERTFNLVSRNNQIMNGGPIKKTILIKSIQTTKKRSI